MEANTQLKESGIDEVLIFCVNDAAVMKAWAVDQGLVDGKLTKHGNAPSIISFLSDPKGVLPGILGTKLTHPGPNDEKGLVGRTKRFAVYLEDGVMKYGTVSEKPDDPAGDEFPESSCAPAMLAEIAKLKKAEL